MGRTNTLFSLASFIAACVVTVLTRQAVALNENQVLVVYNSQNSDSQAIYNHYTSVHGGVIGFDLNDPTLTSGNISYANYESKIRDPLRNFLSANNLIQQVHVITLTKGLPHRIQDSDNANVGDSPANTVTEFNNGDATFASVDSELTLLWQNLGSGEAGGQMDSPSDNLILNPYHAGTQSITSFSRSTITDAREFENISNLNAAWRMREFQAGPGFGNASNPGAIYLTARLDGNTAQQVIDSINRAQNLTFNRLTDQIVIDENDNRQTSGGDEFDDTALFSPKGSDPSYQGNDYDDLAALLSGGPTLYDATVFNQNGTQLIGANTGAFTGSLALGSRQSITGPVAGVVSFGGNHNSSNTDNTGWLATFEGQLVDGAIMVSFESFNAKAFGGLGGFADQGQLSQWLAIGGTFGIGNVWEPFAFSVADAELLFSNFLFGGLTWVEAAWTSIPYLSWQQLVIGDPLARVTIVIPEPGTGALLLATLAVTLRRRRAA